MRYFILFMFVCSFAWAGDYVCFDNDGNITERYYSIDSNHQSNATARDDCKLIPRDQYKSLTGWHKYNQTAKDIYYDQEGKDKYDSDQQKDQDDYDTFITNLKAKMKADYTDEEISFILNN